MPALYDKFRYITPSRTEALRSPESLFGFEARGWWAQVKKNGSRSVIFVSPDRNLDCWNRHHERRPSWHFDAETGAPFRNIPGSKWFAFDGELLDQQTTHIKNTHYLYDILVCDGVHLTGTKYEFRHRLLMDIFLHRKRPALVRDHYVVHPSLWIAHNFTSQFETLYRGLDAKEDEGLVLRDPRGVYYSTKADAWMVKVRPA